MTESKVLERIELLVNLLAAHKAEAPWFDSDGTSITDPTMSDCGRFPVDPCDEYGDHNVLQWIREAEEMTKSKIMTIRELFDWEDQCGINRRWIGGQETHDLDALPDLLRDYGIDDGNMDAIIVCSWDAGTSPCLPNEDMHVRTA